MSLPQGVFLSFCLCFQFSFSYNVVFFSREECSPGFLWVSWRHRCMRLTGWEELNTHLRNIWITTYFVISVLNIELWMNLKCDDRKNPLHPRLWIRLFPQSVLEMMMSSSNTTCVNSGEGTCPSKPPTEILSYTLLCRCPSRDQARSCLLRIISSFLLWFIITLCCSRLAINYFIFNLHPEIGQHRPCDPCQAMPWGQRLKITKLCLCIS